MPKIPKRKTKVGTGRLPGVPDTVTRPFAKEHLAIAELGGSVAKLANMIDTKMKEAEDNDFINENKLGDIRALSAAEVDIKNNLPPDGSGLSEGLREFYNKRIADNISNAPSKKAADDYQRTANDIFQRMMVETDSYETSTKASFFKDNISKRADDIAKTQVISPDAVRLLEDEYPTIEQDVAKGVGTHFNHKHATALIEGKKRQATKGYFQGLLDQNQIEAGKQQLEGKGIGGDLVQNLTPDDLVALKRRFKSSGDYNRGLTLSEINSDVRNLESALYEGQEVEDSIVSGVKFKATSKLGADDKRALDIHVRLDSAKAAGEIIKNYSQQSPSQMMESMKVLDGKNPLTAKITGRARNVAMAQAESHLKERKKDPAGYILKHDVKMQERLASVDEASPEEVQKFSDDMLARQSQLNIPSIQQNILTKQQVGMMAQDIIAHQDPIIAAGVLNKMRQNYGDHFPKVMEELVNNGKLPSDYAIIPHISDPVAQADIISNIRNKKVIGKEFKAQHPLAAGTGDASLSAMVNKEIEEQTAVFAQIPGDNSKLQFSTALRSQVQTKAQTIMIQQGEDADMKDATEQAIQEVVGNNFSELAGGNSKVLMPRAINGKINNPRNVEGFINAYSKAENLKNFKVPIPEKYKADFGADAESRFYEDLEDRSMWDMNSSNDGLILIIVDKGQKAVVVGGDGKPIERSYQDISLNPDDITLEESKTSIQKVGDFFGF